MKQLAIFFLLLFSLTPLAAQVKLSDQAQISLLTASPSDEEVFTLYGHSSLRVKDPEHKMDAVFNYGIFSFNQPNFILRFTLGKTDYMLGVYSFNDYAIDYQMRGSQVTEQVLNLTPSEKQQIWEFLAWNAQKENRTYRYNFFFDNCATRPRDIIEKNVDGEVKYLPHKANRTFRDLIAYCTREHSWYTFGCDLVLGTPTDRIATQREEMFLPDYLKDGIENATIMAADGTERKLVASSSVLIEGIPSDYKDNIITPMVAGILLLLVTFALTFVEWKKRTYFRAVDIVLFAIAGLSGSMIFFLSFISEHPGVQHNWNLIWLNPLQLLAVILFSVKKLKIAAYCYHFINFAALTLLLIGWKWIPQHMEPAFIPFILTLWVRSGYSIYRFIKNR